jgi:hypothetical protein
MQKHVQKAQVVGSEKLRDKNTVHLKGEVTGEKLNPLMGNTLKAEVCSIGVTSTAPSATGK